MAAPRPAGRFGLAKLRLAGVAFLLVIAGLVGLTVALYNKVFADVVHVELRADRAGNQLSSQSDVKVRGLVVGRVTDVQASPDGAVLDLAIDRDKASLVPSNVSAQLLPKTLFGEKFVSLALPPQGQAARPVQDGDVIPQDRSQTALETAKVVNDLLPLLQSLKPDDLSSALNAVSGALRGRGDQIGENLEITDAYLAQLNPALPTIRADLRGLADLADTYDAAAPDLLAVLDNLSFSSRSLVDQQDELRTFLSTSTTFSDSLDRLLRDNETRLVSLANDSLPSLQLFARYAPEYACVFQGLVKYDPIVSDTFGGLQPGLHITLEVTKDQGGFVPGDEPRYRDTRGPYCDGLPSPAVPAPAAEFADGYRDGASAASVSSASSSDPTLLLQTPEAQRMALDAVVAPVLGVPTDRVTDLSVLLFGPAARGTTVELR